MIFLYEHVSIFINKCMEVVIYHNSIQYTNIVPYLLVSSKPHLVRAFLASMEHGPSKNLLLSFILSVTRLVTPTVRMQC